MKYEIIDKLEKVVNEYPKRLAYINSDSFITYEQLFYEAKQLSKKLITYSEKFVVLYGHKEIFMPITIVACYMANKTYVPIDYHFPKERIKNIINCLEEYIIISDTKLSDYKCYSIDNLPENNDATKPNKYVYTIFTSGSTGKPKGVLINKENLNNFVNWISNSYPFSSYKNKTILDQASFSFDLSVADFYYGLCNGHTLVAYDNKNDSISYIYDVLYKNKVNIMFVTPSFARLCLLERKFNEANYPNLECIYFCGEQLNKDVVEKLYQRFSNIKLVNAYGPTEATSAVSLYLLNKNEINNYKYIPVGSMNNTACNVSIENDEIILSGRSVFGGYLKTNKHIDVYKTGDIGEIKDNLLFCKGRKDNQIKYSGYRIELEEIESVTNQIKGVEQSLVVPVKNELENVIRLVLYIVKSGSVTKEEILEYLKMCLPKYMIPSEVQFIKEIPLNENGKMIREKIKND